MIDRLRRRPQPLVCLDFGGDRLTALELVEGAVTRWTSRSLPSDALQNGDPRFPGLLGESVRKTLVRAGIEARQARMALPDEATVSRHLRFPAMPGRDLVRAMHFAAEKHIPFSIDRARWAWDVVERRAGQVTVYLVATWRDVVERYAEMATAAELVPEVLEPRAVAVSRALAQEHALLLDGSDRRLQVTLVVGGQPTFLDEVATAADGSDRRQALDRLLQRAYRHQSAESGGAGRLAPVLLAGDMETTDLRLPVEARPVSDVLNGQLPLAPREFRPGGYLANLGLGLREPR